MSEIENVIGGHFLALSSSALGPPVQCVAVGHRCDGRPKDWAAYCGASGDAKLVRRYGMKLPRRVAEVLFPDFAAEFTWRD